MIFNNPNLYIQNAGSKGRGVFTKRKIRKGLIFDLSPVLIIEGEFIDAYAPFIINEYVFRLKENKVCLCLGFGSLYNHSKAPNASCTYDKDNNVMVFQSLETIPKSAEITINYNGQDADEDRFLHLT